MASTVLPPDPFTATMLNETIGAILIGGLLTAILYGVTNVQIFIFYSRNHTETWLMKSLIGFLWILDSLHLAFITYTLYYYLVMNFLNPLGLFVPIWSLSAQVVVTSVSDTVIRCIFTRRVWILSRGNRLLTGLSLSLAFVNLLGGTAFAAKSFTTTNILNVNQFSWLLYGSLGSATAADLCIAGSMCYFLSQSRTGFKETDNLIMSLMLYCVNTGLLTSIGTIGCLVAYAVSPDTFIFMGIYFTLSKLFFNALLAMLNARDSLRERSHVASGTTTGAWKTSRGSTSFGRPFRHDKKGAVHDLAVSMEMRGDPEESFDQTDKPFNSSNLSPSEAKFPRGFDV